MFLDHLFDFFNTAILVGVFYVAYQRYLRPKIVGDIEKRHAENERNLLQHREFSERLVEISRERSEQEADYHNLSEKVALWKKAHANLMEKRVAEFNDAQVKLEAREKAQFDRMLKMRISARVIPQALAQARLELYDHFHQEGVGEDYLKEVFADLVSTSKDKRGGHGRHS